jgi:hypothetical protein
MWLGFVFLSFFWRIDQNGYGFDLGEEERELLMVFLVMCQWMNGI